MLGISAYIFSTVPQRSNFSVILCAMCYVSTLLLFVGEKIKKKKKMHLLWKTCNLIYVTCSVLLGLQ